MNNSQLISCWIMLVVLSMMTVGCGTVVVVPVEEEARLGKEAAKQVEQQMGIYQATQTTDYIRSVGNRLVANLDDRQFNFSFQIVDQSEPNAFALPGGHIYVSRGLLVLANNEDELAGVIGHEIIHVTRRHSMRQAQKSVLPGLLTLPGRVVGRVVSQDLGTLVNAPIESVGEVFLAQYSRGQESEADELGIQLAARSGYDPKALSAILARLEKDAELQTGKEQKFSFFDSHPTTPTRVKDLNRDSAKIQWSPQPTLASNQKDFLNRLDGLFVTYNPAQGTFHGQQFLQPTMNFSITFPDHWKAVNTPTAVGAVQQDKKALAFLGVAGKPADPEDQAKAFIEKLRREFKISPSSTRSVTIGQWPGYAVTYTDTSGREPMHLHLLWVAAEEATYRLIGIGSDQYRDSLLQIALSLRPLTDEDRSSITGIRLRIATANPGETLADLGHRTNNIWSPAYAAMINHISEEKRLGAGELIKIAREEPYRPVLSKP
jgi:predicted Zn-dependent protease